MAIPKEILAVERPKNTRVKQSGDRFLVIKRTCKRVDGRNYLSNWERLERSWTDGTLRYGKSQERNGMQST